MNTITIRGIDTQLSEKIKEKSKKSGESINKMMLKILRSTFGLEKNKTFPTYHDLDDLAGTWTEQDEKEFNKNTKDLRKIDKELWE